MAVQRCQAFDIGNCEIKQWLLRQAFLAFLLLQTARAKIRGKVLGVEIPGQESDGISLTVTSYKL